MLRIVVSSVLFFASQAFAAAPQYQWKAGDLYRYDYERTTVVSQPDESGVSTERKTTFKGVLIIEIRSVDNGTASALMRFDDPRLTLPPQLFYGAQQEAITENTERSAAVERAMIAAIKLARWTVTLRPNGSLHIDSRVPEKFTEWTREVSNLGRWRTRLSDILGEILEKDAGLKVDAEVQDLLLVFAPAAEPTTPAASMRPLRSYTQGSQGGGKSTYTLQRVFPASAQNGYQVPGLLAKTAVTMKPGSVEMQEGSAVLDTRLGLLDTLSESYIAPIVYSQGAETLKQSVSVVYRLKRLAPAITQAE